MRLVENKESDIFSAEGNIESLFYKLFAPHQGELYGNNRGIGLHSGSIRRLAEAVHAHPDKMICVCPEVPCASEHGLPACGEVARWVPQGLNNISPENSLTLTDTSMAERCFYYGDEYIKFFAFPKQVSVVVSNQCNLKCVMCPYHGEDVAKHSTGYFKKPQRISAELVELVIDQCAAHGAGMKVGNIEEPLLYPRMASFVSRARARGVPRFHITTNGTLLTPDISRALLEGGLTSLYVSIDAFTQERYTAIRRSELALVKNNLLHFLQLRAAINPQCLVMTSYVKNFGDDHDAEMFRDFWMEMVDGVIFYELNRLDEKSNTKLLSLNSSIEEMIKDRLETYGHWPCLNPFNEMYVLPDGNTAYCCTTIASLGVRGANSMGNALETPLDQIWKGQPFVELRKGLLSNTLAPDHMCATCPVWTAHVSQSVQEDGMRVTRNIITTIYTKK